MPKETSFAEILRAKMTESNCFTEGKTKSWNQSTGPFPSEKGTYLDLDILSFTLKSDVFRSIKPPIRRDFTLYKSEKAKYPDPPRPPRNWNEGQKQALKSLISLGALEINDCSTDQQIKKAFRRLAKLYHPDLNKDSPQGQVFIKLHATYKMLLKS